MHLEKIHFFFSIVIFPEGENNETSRYEKYYEIDSGLSVIIKIVIEVERSINFAFSSSLFFFF